MSFGCMALDSQSHPLAPIYARLEHNGARPSRTNGLLCAAREGHLEALNRMAHLIDKAPSFL